MKNEAAFKSAFKKSVRQYGGFSLSLAAPMVAGIPDLYVVMPGYMPVLLEAKFIKGVGEKFKRKVDVSEIQRHWLNCCNEVNYLSAMVLIGIQQGKTIHCVLSRHDCLTSFSIGSQDLNLAHRVVYNKGFDVKDLFRQSPIPRMRPRIASTFPDAISLDKSVNGMLTSA